MKVVEEKDGSFTLHGLTDEMRETLIEKGLNYILMMEIFKVDESEVFNTVKRYAEVRDGIET